ncbi:MAG: endolytic transglycosylase MltG [Bacteroidia bacterium]|nr:endolytic transglycosylase MltG [Bacteroidia bacterium]
MVSKKKKFRRILWIIVVVLLVITAALGVKIYNFVFSPNVRSVSAGPNFVLIPTGSDIDDVVRILKERNFLIDEKSFLFSAQQMKYADKVKPGRYLLEAGMNNKELVSLLRSGRQTPIKLIFNNIRTKNELALRIGEQIEASPDAILNLMNDPDYVAELGFTTENILCLFIPDTYEFYWNTSADQFMKKMLKEYQKFWNPVRTAKAVGIAFNPVEVSIIASIVQQESNQATERPTIAGVYINRVRKNWKLEADPTLVYALGDFEIKRVLNEYKKIDSPYNTYMYKGLPPGPICLPSKSSIEAVLNYSKHNYMYFCAREDFSGYHNFANSYVQHLINARKFQKALNKRGIRS